MAATAPLPGLQHTGPSTSTGLAEVLRHPGIWRRGSRPSLDTEATGIPELDAHLPGGGWPRGALVEILTTEDGVGECSLLLPALAAFTRARRRVVLVGPPYLPYAPALAAAGVDLSQLVEIDAEAGDQHWSAEQCLRAGCCAAVLAWLPRADYRQLRRLQLAASSGNCTGFLFRPASAAAEASPAALRLAVRREGEGEGEGITIEILKCRGQAGFPPRLRTGQAGPD